MAPDGRDVWQIKKSAKVVNEGFAVDKKGSWKEVTFSHFRNSPNVFVTGNRYTEYENVLKFGLVRRVSLGLDSVETYLKLAEKTRVDVCLNMSAEKFLTDVLPDIETDIEDIMLLPNKLKLMDKYLLAIFQPRDGKLELTKIGADISLVFRNGGFGTPFKKAFTDGEDVDEAYSPF